MRCDLYSSRAKPSRTRRDKSPPELRLTAISSGISTIRFMLPCIQYNPRGDGMVTPQCRLIAVPIVVPLQSCREQTGRAQCPRVARQPPGSYTCGNVDRKSVVQGKRVDL